jgi:hypothetical protein
MRGRGVALLVGMKAGENRAKQEQAAKQQGAQQAQQQAAPSPAPAPSGGGDISAQLQNLTNMHNAGQLSDEEYAAAKKKLLG